MDENNIKPEENNVVDILNTAYEAMNQKQFNKALTFFNLAIKKLEEFSKQSSYYAERLNEVNLMAKNCKSEIRNELLEKVKILIEKNKIPLILEHYEMIILLTKEIGDIENLEEFEKVYNKYNQIFQEKETTEIRVLMEQASTLKNKGKFEKSLEIYRETLTKAKMINNKDLVESLENQLSLIPLIKQKERRKQTLDQAQKALEDGRYLLAISHYKLASKYSADLGEPDKEKDFLAEAKKVGKLKGKLEKQRKKEDYKIEEILVKADVCIDEGNYLEAIKLYQEVRALRDSIGEFDEQLNSIINTIELNFIENFLVKKIPEQIKDILKLVKELTNENENFSLITLFNRASKTLLIPKDEIALIIYILHKLLVFI
ncbi:MAG: hypothetical protein HWN67_20895 [Candidatus Helarchaeota archaeon]|nr:hypothetical protein [Candidatus Helarchaeota archaeon]